MSRSTVVRVMDRAGDNSVNNVNSTGMRYPPGARMAISKAVVVGEWTSTVLLFKPVTVVEPAVEKSGKKKKKMSGGTAPCTPAIQQMFSSEISH